MTRKNMTGKLSVFLIAILVTLQPLGASAQVIVKWKPIAALKLVLVPNYASGFGPIKATFGAPGAPTPGAGASYQGGAVDFGTVLTGTNYLYRYAAHVNVQTNGNGFNLFAEGSGDFTGTGANTGNSLPINQTIYYLQSTDGSGGDPNSGFSPATPFQKTTQPGATYNNGTINYLVYPAPIASYSLQNADLYYDFQMKIPGSASLGTYYVYVVYTALPT